MQQGTEAIELAASNGGNALPAPSPDGRFVINLLASTTPVALTQASHPELKRFTFFVSRRREDGRERFRLHMGYFRSQEDAERLLEVVREFYPAAWAGVAPGQKLASPQSASVAAPKPQPELPAAPIIADTAPVAKAVPTPPAPAAIVPVTPPPVAAGTAAPIPLRRPAPPAAPPVPRAAAPAPMTPEARDNAAIKTSLSSVRAAIAALDGNGPAPLLMPRKLADLQPPASVPTLSDSQVLRVLESPKAASSSAAAAAAAAAPRSEATSFAVQLMWSVQPIDISQVPQLAIFNAYTLYGAEGNRDGRRWYGVRLGFFTDAVSAKQVAQYVRSEFTSVSVVPVTTRERERATMGAAQAAPKPAAVAAPPAAPVAAPVAAPSISGQFKLLDNTAERRIFDSKAPAKPVAVAAKGRPPGKRAKPRAIAERKPDGGQMRKSQTLEETLEILGANELYAIDNGRYDPLVNDAGVRHVQVKVSKSPSKGSRLGKLISRLTERMNDD